MACGARALRLGNGGGAFGGGLGAGVNEFSGGALHCDASEGAAWPALPPPAAARSARRRSALRRRGGEQVLATMALDGLTPAQNLAALGAIG